MLAFFKKVAPWLAAGAEFIPGAGPIISAGLTDIAKSNNITLPSGDIKPTVDSISEAVVSIAGHPEGLQALKAQDQNYALQMQAANFKSIEDIQALGNADRASARDMQTQNKSRIPGSLAISITLGFFILLGGMMFGKFKPADNQALLLLLGSLSMAFGAVIQFYFGSSASSDRKTELLAQAEPIKK